MTPLVRTYLSPIKVAVPTVSVALVLVLGGLALSAFRARVGAGSDVALTDSSSTVQPVSVFKEVAKPIYFPPVLLKFKTKTLSVEAVGVEDGGFLGVPSSWHTAGWYAEGAKPGEEGNVILDGHYDTNTGAPGAFWELKAVQIGDTVVLTDKLGRDFYYQVTSKSFISITDPDRAQVFASGKEKVLTLITCGGMWDYASGTYNKRLVITAVFAKMEKKW